MAYLLLALLSVKLCNSQLNQYVEGTGPNGEDLWTSTSDFIPAIPIDNFSDPMKFYSTYYGTIKMGQIMTMEFDFLFHGRSTQKNVTRDPQCLVENFFRIGAGARFGP